MKKLLFLLALSFVQMSFAQENNLRKIISNNSQNVKIRDNKNFQNVLYVINGMPTFSDCSAINVQNIESINVIKGERATELYGYRAKNGVLIFITKPESKLLNLRNFYTEYNISKANQFLPIVLNKHLNYLFSTISFPLFQYKLLFLLVREQVLQTVVPPKFSQK